MIDKVEFLYGILVVVIECMIEFLIFIVKYCLKFNVFVIFRFINMIKGRLV